MRVGVVSPYLATMGGGERYLLTAVEFFLSRGDEVDVFSNSELTTRKIRERFNLDLEGARFVPDIFFGKGSFLGRISKTRKYDLMFFVSDGSVPTTLSSRNILHFQVPFNYHNQRTIANQLKLSRFSRVVCNSYFTKKFVDATYGVNSTVVYPPVDVQKFKPGKKENLILSVGRFFAPLQAKKQEVLIEVFKKMKPPGWRLVLVGGIDENQGKRIRELLSRAGESPVEVVTDASFGFLQNYYSRAKIYWHAAGYSEDLEKFPERAEHFGITTVEAMAAGCVPIVFGGGGQLEIVEDGESGILWKTLGGLRTRTATVMKDERMRKRLAERAIIRSEAFSKERFYEQLEKIVV